MGRDVGNSILGWAVSQSNPRAEIGGLKTRKGQYGCMKPRFLQVGKGEGGKGEGLVLKPKPRFNTRIDPWWPVWNVHYGLSNRLMPSKHTPTKASLIGPISETFP